MRICGNMCINDYKQYMLIYIDLLTCEYMCACECVCICIYLVGVCCTCCCNQLLNSSSNLFFISIHISVANILLITEDFENHRTNTSYEDSMILKIFMFQFVNSYAS